MTPLGGKGIIYEMRNKIDCLPGGVDGDEGVGEAGDEGVGEAGDEGVGEAGDEGVGEAGEDVVVGWEGS